MLEELQYFSCAGMCRYQLKAKNSFCLVFASIIFQSHLTRLNGAFIFSFAIPVTLVMMLPSESNDLLCYMQILARREKIG